ncbi:MAG: transporter [Bacteroidia bacterium]|nr:transporter [Bacteroidia bacterium]
MANVLFFFKSRIRFDRNEFSGAFGDIGTDLPLIIGMILASGLDSASVLITYGIMQLLTAMLYGIPMPVQPLKAVAMIVITQKIAPEVIYGGGLAIGVLMLVLSLTGLVDLIAKYIPKVVVRGIQFGLGIQLSMVALKEYVVADSFSGYWLAGIAFIITIILLGNRKYPPAIFIIIAGVAYALIFKFTNFNFVNAISFSIPKLYTPSWTDILTGFLILALPQIPLSIGNSIIATKQMATDYFPEKKITVKKISLTYSIINIINPFLGGVPTCHGSGGMAGHYAFGARTGGSVFIYGILFLILGFFFSGSFEQIVKIFPLPVLGVILLFEGLTLMIFIKDIIDSKKSFFIALLVALIACGLPYGYLIGMIVGTIMYYISDKKIKNYFKIK